jgi:hypothetical protein
MDRCILVYWFFKKIYFIKVFIFYMGTFLFTKNDYWIFL